MSLCFAAQNTLVDLAINHLLLGAATKLSADSISFVTH